MTMRTVITTKPTLEQDKVLLPICLTLITITSPIQVKVTLKLRPNSSKKSKRLSLLKKNMMKTCSPIPKQNFTLVWRSIWTLAMISNKHQLQSRFSIQTKWDNQLMQMVTLQLTVLLIPTLMLLSQEMEPPMVLNLMISTELPWEMSMLVLWKIKDLSIEFSILLCFNTNQLELKSNN